MLSSIKLKLLAFRRLYGLSKIIVSTLTKWFSLVVSFLLIYIKKTENKQILSSLLSLSHSCAVDISHSSPPTAIVWQIFCKFQLFSSVVFIFKLLSRGLIFFFANDIFFHSTFPHLSQLWIFCFQIFVSFHL